ncbi:sigma-70 family RNA polymerase sigma factor [Nemorincola caseinilytica]|uniref:Sigma-70 family RNA polymerase sigma factor n=1 Tax=Nemorincola caseinilytica TaxID=2054315 RepID=A0ABP8NG48_9BACT
MQGHRPSQKQLYDHFAPKMLGVCYRYARTLQEAEDFLQEAFITVFRKLDQYRNEGPLGKWIYRIVINTCINGIRARCRFSDTAGRIDVEHLENESTAHPAAHSEIIELVRQLPTVYMTVFNLHAVEGYPHEDIAKMLDTNVNTVRSQYSRARTLLMKKLGSGPKTNENGKRG